MAATVASPWRAARTTGGVLRVPWVTVMVFAVVFAFTDEFWIVALRGAVGSISRTDEPFATWLRESALLLPVYAFSVLAALTLALRWFGPHLQRRRAAATILSLVVTAATLTALLLLVINAAYDYRLQSAELQASTTHGTCDTDCLAQRQQATLNLHIRAFALGGMLLLGSNLVFAGLVFALRGGRIDVASSRPETGPPACSSRQHPVPQVGAPADDAAGKSSARRFDELQRVLAVGLVATAFIHIIASGDELGAWPGAGALFGILGAAETGLALLVITRLSRPVTVAAAVISSIPLVLWACSSTVGMPFGPEAGFAEPVGLIDGAAACVHATTLGVALLLLRAREWLQQPIRWPHPHRLALVAVVAATVVGLGSSIGSSSRPAGATQPTQHLHIP